MTDRQEVNYGKPTTIDQITEKLGALVTSTHFVPENRLENKSDAKTSIKISSVSSPDFAGPEQVAFVTQPKYFEKALAGSASVLCFPEKNRDAVTKRLSGAAFRPHFFSKEPELAMRETIQRFFQSTPYINRDFAANVHPTAVIHRDAGTAPAARIAPSARIGPFAVIASDVEIGDDAVIGAHTVVERGSKIGARTVLHPFVYIGPTTDIGRDCEINSFSSIGKEGFGYAHDLKNNHYRIPHTGRVIIGDRVHLGSNVNVDRGTFENTEIRAGAILDNRIQISHNVVIGENSIITAGFVAAGSAKIGKNFLTGGNSAVTGHIELCDGVQLAALSVVRKSITKPGAYGGNPLMPMREYLRATTALAKLPRLLAHFRKLLGDESTEET